VVEHFPLIPRLGGSTPFPAGTGRENVEKAEFLVLKFLFQSKKGGRESISKKVLKNSSRVKFYKTLNLAKLVFGTIS